MQRLQAGAICRGYRQEPSAAPWNVAAAHGQVISEPGTASEGTGSRHGITVARFSSAFPPSRLGDGLGGTSSQSICRGTQTAPQKAGFHIQNTYVMSHHAGHVGTDDSDDSGVWGRQWATPISVDSLHEEGVRSPSIPSHASTSNGSFPTSQYIKEFKEDFTVYGEWEAALEVEIENPGNLGGRKSSPLHSSPRKGPQLKRRRMAAAIAQKPSL